LQPFSLKNFFTHPQTPVASLLWALAVEGECGIYNKHYIYAEHTPSVAFGASSLNEGAKIAAIKCNAAQDSAEVFSALLRSSTTGFRPSLRMTARRVGAAICRPKRSHPERSIALQCGVEPEGRGNASGSDLK